MNHTDINRAAFLVLLICIFACGNVLASGEEEKELFISELQKAADCYNQGREAEAVRIIDEASEKYLQSNWSYSVCGYLLSRMENDELALYYYEKALAIDPRYAPAWYNKGISLSNLQRTDEAEVCFVRAEELDSRYEIPWTKKWPFPFIIENFPIIFGIIGFGIIFFYFVKNELLR